MTAYNNKYFEEMAEAAEKGEFTPIPHSTHGRRSLSDPLWQCSKQQQKLTIQNLHDILRKGQESTAALTGATSATS